MRPIIPRARGPIRLLMYLRFARYLLWEFRWALGVFWSLVVLGGLLLHVFYHREGVTLSFARACHAVFLLIFLESSLDFPDEWYLQPLFFLLPVVGLGAVADSLDSARLSRIHQKAEPAGVESHARLAVSQPFRGDRGRQGRLPGDQGSSWSFARASWPSRWPAARRFWASSLTRACRSFKETPA